MPEAHWTGQRPGSLSPDPPYIAELTGDWIHWRCAGDYDYRISEIDEQQSVEDFKSFGPPSSDIPQDLARDVAAQLGINGDFEPAWLKAPDERVIELVEAVAGQDWQRFEALRGAINAFSPLGKTAVVHSLEMPVSVLKALLQRGADPNPGLRRGTTPLMLACSLGRVHHARALLHGGANVAARDSIGRTALACAGYEGKQGCAALLLVEHYRREGIEVSPDEVIAALYGHLVPLAEEMARRSPSPASRELLFAAIRGGSLKLFRFALDNGIPADIREFGDFEITPLIAAAQLPHQEMFLRELLARGADPNGQDNRGEPALVWACKVAYREILLAAGADPDSRCHTGHTLLHRLCEQKARIRDIRMLLDAGANVNASQPGNETPLHCASGQGNLALIKLLLDRGADPSVVDQNGHDAVWWARTPRIAAMLKGRFG